MKKLLTFVLSFILLTTSILLPVSAQQVNNAETTAKIRASILKRGTGEKKRVSVTMLSGTKFKGYISQADNDSFTLIDSNIGQPTIIAYSGIKQVKGSGGLGTGGIIAIAAVGVGVAIIASFLIRRCRNEGGCQ